MAHNEDMTDDTRDALDMVGIPIVQFEPPAQQIIQTKKGFKTVTSQGWIKYSIALRNVLASMKGARLSVFTAICLHVNESGEAWPSLDTLMAETGYQRAAVVEAIKHLKDIGLLKVDSKKHRSSTYIPLYAAYGDGSEIKLPAVRKSNHSSSEIKPEVEPLSRTKEVEKHLRPPKTTKPKYRPRNPVFDAIASVCSPSDPTLREAYIKANGSWIAKIANNGAGHFPPEKIMEWYGDGGWWYTVRCKGLPTPPRPNPANIQKTIALAAEWDQKKAHKPTLEEIREATFQSEGAQRMAEFRKRHGAHNG